MAVDTLVAVARVEARVEVARVGLEAAAVQAPGSPARRRSADSAAGASVALAAKPTAPPKQLIIAAMIALFAMVVGLVYELIAGR